MDIYAKKGHKVRFTGKGGYEMENKYANSILEPNKIYTVNHTEVGQSYTSVYLEEIELVRMNGEKDLESFNSVMFEDVV